MAKNNLPAPLILDETHPLEQVMVWGEPGVEALLGQLLPKHKSLFRNYYQVPAARQEFRHMQALMEGHGINVMRAKDAVVRLLAGRVFPSMPGRVRDLKTALQERAESYYRVYRKQKARELEYEQSPLGVEEFHAQVLQDLDAVLEEDIAAYGEQGAIRLNYLLSLYRAWPQANIFYGRDQTQVIADRVLLSSLKWEIRRPEVRIFEEALHELGLQASIVPVSQGTLEGGDLAMFHGACWVGVGARTSLPAVLDVARRLGDVLAARNLELLAMVNAEHVDETNFYFSPTSEHMEIMHLDMFWIPLAPDLVMAYGGELDRREVIRVGVGKTLGTVERLGGARQVLAGRGVQVMEVSHAEQQNFATNLLNLGNGHLLAALSSNPRVNQELTRLGFELSFANLDRLVGGFGAVHCLTAPLRRGN